MVSKSPLVGAGRGAPACGQALEPSTLRLDPRREDLLRRTVPALAPHLRRGRRVTSCVLLALLALVNVPGSARAGGPPSPIHSTFPRGVTLVGERNGVPDAKGYFEVAVADTDDVAMANVAVELDLTNVPQFVIADPQSYPGVDVVDPECRIVRAFTDASGVARFIVVGSLWAHPSCDSLPSRFAALFAGGTLLDSVSVAALDLDVVDGSGPHDMHLWLCDFLSAFSPGHSDYTHSGVVDPGDLAFLASAILDRSSEETAYPCVPGDVPTGNVLTIDGGLSLTRQRCYEYEEFEPNYSGDLCAANKHTNFIAWVTLPPGTSVNPVTGVEATFRVYDWLGSEPLPPYFHFQQPDGCNRTRLNTLNYPAGECLDNAGTWNSGMFASAGKAYYPHPETDDDSEEMIRVVTAVADPMGAVGTGTHALTAFRIRHGLPDCSGCGSNRVHISLEQIRLTTSTPNAAGHSDLLPSPTPTTIVINAAPGDLNVIGTGPNPLSVAPGPSGELRLMPVHPNPSRGEIDLGFALPAATRVRLGVYDVAGRQLRSLLDAPFPAGMHEIRWNGRTDSGGRVPPGLYYARLSTERGKVVRPVVILP
jgi:hypothetical protein